MVCCARVMVSVPGRNSNVTSDDDNRIYECGRPQGWWSISVGDKRDCGMRTRFSRDKRVRAAGCVCRSTVLRINAEN